MLLSACIWYNTKDRLLGVKDLPICRVQGDSPTFFLGLSVNIT